MALADRRSQLVHVFPDGPEASVVVFVSVGDVYSSHGDSARAKRKKHAGV